MQSYLAQAFESAPPLFSISQVPTLYPGLVAEKTLRNSICAGTGPEVIRLGRRVVLSREAFFDWLSARAKAA